MKPEDKIKQLEAEIQILKERNRVLDVVRAYEYWLANGKQLAHKATLVNTILALASELKAD